VSAETDTLAAIGGNPGYAAQGPSMDAATIIRLAREGLIEHPAATGGRLYLTQAGKDRLHASTVRRRPDPFTRPVPTLAQVTEETARAVDGH
jgi:hypothetical protein